MPGNFPIGELHERWFALGAELDENVRAGIEAGLYTCATSHPFIAALIDTGALPHGCCDFTIDLPVDGIITITARYFVDKKAFEGAIRLSGRRLAADAKKAPKSKRSRGGTARAARLTPERRGEIAKKAADKRWKKEETTDGQNHD